MHLSRMVLMKVSKKNLQSAPSGHEVKVLHRSNPRPAELGHTGQVEI